MRDLLAATMWTLAQHPDQMRALADDQALAKQAVEEVLRWVTPVPGFMRNATQDIELRGQTIKQGQYVYLLYFAANRDEECWTDPDTFDITRPSESAVLSFGFGEHACIGAAVARLRRAFSWRRCWPVSPPCPWPEKPSALIPRCSTAGTSCRSRSTGDCPRQGAHRPAASAMNSISA